MAGSTEVFSPNTNAPRQDASPWSAYGSETPRSFESPRCYAAFEVVSPSHDRDATAFYRLSRLH